MLIRSSFPEDNKSCSRLLTIDYCLELSPTSLVKQLRVDNYEDMENKGKQCSSYGKKLPLGLNKATHNDPDFWMLQC